MRGTFRGSSSVYRSMGGWLVAAALAAGGAGCSSSGWRFRTEDQFGRTYYVDGAGNWGFGRLAVPRGLREAGYRGRVKSFTWTATLNPALDQALGPFVAKAKGKVLAREIENYLEHYPDNEVHIIALSAGTGVAVWACEHLKPPARVGNMILLSSSLSSDYNMSKALAHVQGKVYVYSSPNDGVLSGPVHVLGTIDGRFDCEPAGLVGLRSSSPQICNVNWSSRYEGYGWTGSHVSSVQEAFVRHVLAQHVTASETTGVAKVPQQDTVHLATQ